MKEDKSVTVEEKRKEVMDNHKRLQEKLEKLYAKRDGLVATLADTHKQMEDCGREMAHLSGQFAVLQAIHAASESKRESQLPENVDSTRQEVAPVVEQ